MKAELPKYPSYQRCEAEWLGEIPEGWSAMRLSRLNTKLTNGFVGPTRDILVEKGVRYLQSLHIEGGKIVFKTPYFVTEKWSRSHAKSILKVGDVLIVQTGADTGEVAAVNKNFEGCNCHALIIVSAKEKMLKGEFLSAVLRSHYGMHSLKRIRTGALHPHLNCTLIRDIFIPVPSLSEQESILRFLDRETAKIDKLIEARQQQVERLQEQRNASVFHALEKGLDARAKTRRDDHPWLGNVPAHWDTFRLKFICRINPSKANSGYSPRDEAKVVFLPMECVGTEGQVDQSNRERIRDVWKGFTYFAKGDVLVAKITPCFENGKGAWVADLATDIGFGTTEFHVLRVGKRIMPEFLWWITASPRFRGIGERSMTGAAGQQRVSEQFISNYPVALPPLPEQEKIVTHIKLETARIDKLLAKYKAELDLLAEYRASLISHAVTGKIDVRGLVATPEPELATTS